MNRAKKHLLLTAATVALLLSVAACAEPQQGTTSTAAESEMATEETMTEEHSDDMNGESMDDESMDGESMDGESMDGESMDDESMDDESMDDESMDDESMDDESMDDESMDDESMDDESMDDESMDGESMDGESMDGESMDDTTMSDLPAWQTLALVDVRTEESFTFADFAGKTVFVEPMATWCTNCRQQLNNVKEARNLLASDDVVFIGLSVEANLDNTTLAEYAEREGFDWQFAIVTPELLAELSNEFGRTVANPPSTPHFIIRGDGTFTELITGIEPASDLIAQIQAAQN